MGPTSFMLTKAVGIKEVAAAAPPSYDGGYDDGYTAGYNVGHAGSNYDDSTSETDPNYVSGYSSGYGDGYMDGSSDMGQPNPGPGWHMGYNGNGPPPPSYNDVNQPEYAVYQWEYYPTGHANAGKLKTAEPWGHLGRTMGPSNFTSVYNRDMLLRLVQFWC